MHEVVADIYIIMLSKHWDEARYGKDNRVMDARWALIDLGVPMTVTMVGDYEGRN